MALLFSLRNGVVYTIALESLPSCLHLEHVYETHGADHVVGLLGVNGFHDVGEVLAQPLCKERGYPHKVNAIESLRKRLLLYGETGNADYLTSSTSPIPP